MGNESIKLITADNYNSISFQLQKIKNPLKKLKIKTRNRSKSKLQRLKNPKSTHLDLVERSLEKNRTKVKKFLELKLKKYNYKKKYTPKSKKTFLN